MRIYGLTGGIGSGKSAAAKRFAEHGIPVIDADKIGHDLLDPGDPVANAVVEAFDNTILTEGAIDRDKLGVLVFSDPQARARLNAIVHPAIIQAIARRCADLAEKGREIVIIDAALIAEHGQREEFLAGLIVVDCPEDIRIQRLSACRGMAPEETRKRMATQTQPSEKLAIADWVIDNGGTMAQLQNEVDRVVKELERHVA